MKKLTIAAWIASVIIALVVGVMVAYPTAQIRNLSEEYETGHVIRAVTEHVLDYGAWPEGWDDLELYGNHKKNVRVNWDVDISTADRFEIMQAIQPRTGFYMTYPHAEEDLQYLYDKIVEFRGDAPELAQDVKFPDWGFCVVYQYRDAVDGDARPVDPSGEQNPFGEGHTWIPYTVLNDKGVVDIAALTTRQVGSGLLKRDVASEVIRSTVKGDQLHPIMECYEPHHIFVFYDYGGLPVGAIEVCFSCNRVTMAPEIRFNEGKIGTDETADLSELAKIVYDSGLEITGYKSADEYAQRLKKIKDRSDAASKDSKELEEALRDN